MKNILSILLILVALETYAQNSGDEQLLYVSGISNMTVKPERMKIIVEVSANDTQSEKVDSQLKIKLDDLMKFLLGLGTKPEEIDASTICLGQDLAYGVGFKGQSFVKVQMQYSEEVIQKCKERFSKTPGEKFHIVPFLSDNQKVLLQKEMIQNAIKNAERKANDIVTLNKLQMNRIVSISPGELIPNYEMNSSDNIYYAVNGFIVESNSNWRIDVSLVWEFSTKD